MAFAMPLSFAAFPTGPTYLKDYDRPSNNGFVRSKTYSPPPTIRYSVPSRALVRLDAMLAARKPTSSARSSTAPI